MNLYKPEDKWHALITSQEPVWMVRRNKVAKLIINTFIGFGIGLLIGNLLF